ncbi:MAG: hypothetical protein U5K54_26065 [Cytophagales bacterium]|nr:hypothetical protein [Cytophagales bacterium]
MARIINYVGQLKMKNSDTDILLDKTEQASKYLLTGTKDFLWSIDPLNDNLGSLKVHIRDFGDKILSEKGIEFRVYSSIQEDVPLPFGYTRQINLIFKEAFTNVFKHSQATSVELHFESKPNKIMISLVDNGIGLYLYKNIIVDGEGSANMNIRSSKIGASLEIISKPTGGTTVQLLVDLNEKI